ncbi:TPA: hypothetical protein DDX46_04070 [Candidatus Saccharibacteria bacterium]|nr:MAG: hypothetical protein UW38_C0001G0638 [Candidatus Saccharibacteria bacterium GW2011_GWC2_44_17]OGL24067.1 MAG: hypothetical protein A2791_04160 [Candidatus Saccharibacteria bacterium RIFCSPHIGHO2_01_FULL_46_30]OGL33744.1 MAG: hypothetical protein A3E20_03245 [Candidatus Saccharibacteria bacterium RIFCSPHIGHO2_12_FULL_47_16]HBH77890.1 hypothetical protein [Candidatus Saccharibacteria bacterium]
MKRTRNYAYIDAKINNFIQRKLATFDESHHSTVRRSDAQTTDLDYEAMRLPRRHSLASHQ